MPTRAGSSWLAAPTRLCQHHAGTPRRTPPEPDSAYSPVITMSDTNHWVCFQVARKKSTHSRLEMDLDRGNPRLSSIRTRRNPRELRVGGDFRSMPTRCDAVSARCSFPFRQPVPPGLPPHRQHEQLSCLEWQATHPDQGLQRPSSGFRSLGCPGQFGPASRVCDADDESCCRLVLGQPQDCIRGATRLPPDPRESTSRLTRSHTKGCVFAAPWAGKPLSSLDG